MSTAPGRRPLRRPFGAGFAALLVLGAVLDAAVPGPETFEAVVVAVHDGDTITVRADGRTTRIRLVGIDCPEARQPFAARAKQFTSGLLFGRTVRVEGRGLDRYERLLARILVDATDVNEALVRAGLAWVYDLGTPEPALVAAERGARAARAGLWSDPSPVPPWRWRRWQRQRAERGVQN